MTRYIGAIQPSLGNALWDAEEGGWVVRLRDVDVPFSCGVDCCGVLYWACVLVDLPKAVGPVAAVTAALSAPEAKHSDLQVLIALVRRYRAVKERLETLIDCGPVVGCGPAAGRDGASRLRAMDRLAGEVADLGQQLQARGALPWQMGEVARRVVWPE